MARHYYALGYSLALVARPEGGLDAGAPPMIGRTATAPPGTIPVYVSEPAAWLYGWKVGQRIGLPIAGAPPQGFFVTGVWRDYARQHGAVTLESHDYTALTGDRSRSEASVTLAPGADRKAVAARLETNVPQRLAGRVTVAEPRGLRDMALRLFDLPTGVARLRAARAVIDASGQDVMLIGRAENFVAGRPDLDDAMARLKAYADAGADCLYAPGITTREQIAAVVAAVAPKPVNVLVGSASAWTVADLAALGVRRVSVGGGLARAAWGGFQRAARQLAEQGRFDGFEGAVPGHELNQRMGS